MGTDVDCQVAESLASHFYHLLFHFDYTVPGINVLFRNHFIQPSRSRLPRYQEVPTFFNANKNFDICNESFFPAPHIFFFSSSPWQASFDNARIHAQKTQRHNLVLEQAHILVNSQKNCRFTTLFKSLFLRGERVKDL